MTQISNFNLERDRFITQGRQRVVKNPNYKPTENIETETNQQYISTGLSEKTESDFEQLFANTMGSFLDYTATDVQNVGLINQQKASEEFFKRVGKETTDESLEQYAKGHRGQIYFKPDGTLGRGVMGFWDVSDASNLFQGNFGLLGTEASAMRQKSNIYGSDSLLKTSKAWPKLTEALKISDEDKQQLRDWIEADNSWDRYTEIDNWKDFWEAIPITSLVVGLAGQTPEEVFLQRKDPNFKAQELVGAIQTYDPEFYQFLVEEGVNIEHLSKAENAFHFRFIMNHRIQTNAIQRSLNAVEQYHSTAANWALWGLDQARASLNSADFVGQIALTVATAGLGTALAGGATAINMARGGLQGVQTTINTATRLRALGTGIANTKKYLPLQLPTTVLESVAPALIKNNLPTGIRATGVLAIGHALTGAAEEGLTDVINQTYELNSGTRLDYDMGQTWYAIGMGAAMEPILGGAFKVASVPITLTVGGISNVGSKATQKLFSFSFGIDSSRFKEFNLYLDSVTGDKFNTLSPDEAENRVRLVANQLTIEAALNRISNNEFGKIEENSELIGFLYAILSQDKLATKEGIFQGISTLAAKLLTIKEELDSGLVKDAAGNWVRKSKVMQDKAPDLFVVDENGKVTFTKKGMQAILLSMAVDNITTDAQRTEAITTIITNIVKAEQRKKLSQDETTKIELEKLTPDKQDEYLDRRLNEMLADEANTEIQDRITDLQSLFELVGSSEITDEAIKTSSEFKLEEETIEEFQNEAKELDKDNAEAVDRLIETPKIIPTATSTDSITTPTVTSTSSETTSEISKSTTITPSTPAIEPRPDILPEKFSLKDGWFAEKVEKIPYEKAVEDVGEDEALRMKRSIIYKFKHEDGTYGGEVLFEWDEINNLYRPAPPTGINLWPTAQGKGLYLQFLKEIYMYYDIASTGVDTASGTLPNAAKVWEKLGASKEVLKPNERLAFTSEETGKPQYEAYVMRFKSKKPSASKTVSVTPEVASTFTETAPTVTPTTSAPTTTVIDASTFDSLFNSLPTELQNIIKNFKC